MGFANTLNQAAGKLPPPPPGKKQKTDAQKQAEDQRGILYQLLFGTPKR